jgi:hypothetical protein
LAACEETLVVRRKRACATAPRREDERQTRPLPPCLAEVEHVLEATFDLESGIADD